MPGASPAEVEQRVTRPVEKLLWEIPGVEYVYSTSSPGRSMVVVRFKVGEDQERALVRLNEKLASNRDHVPPGAIGPLVKLRSIDDVPILGITLWSVRYDDHQLRLLAAQLHDAIKEVPDVSDVVLIGGRRRVASVEIDPARLEVYGVDPLMVRAAIQGSTRDSADGPTVAGQTTTLEAGVRLETVAQLRDVVVASRSGRAVRLSDVATVADRDADPSTYVRHHVRGAGAAPAVTIAVAKRAGTNAIAVARRVQAKVAALEGSLVPADVHVEITRDYGETAAEKSNELLYHMGIAVVSVAVLIWIALGRREALVVMVAIPVTLALTLFMFYLYGYTLNRITLFALIFSIGILVDDAIVVVENIVRHMRLTAGAQDGLTAIALRAVDEVGNPTILATLTVVAAILPMAFVGGLMGPYMRPIPVGASAAMVFSLIVAFVVTPWAAVRLLQPHGGHGDGPEDALTRWYRRAMNPLIHDGRRRLWFLVGVVGLLLAAMALVPLKLVTVKMLPFDNKSEFQVIVDMPEGTSLEQTASVTARLATAALEDAAVRNVQDYVGTASPHNFNGLVRHYFLRQSPHLGDLQVNLLPKHDRSEQSHEIARRVRDRLLPIAKAAGATIQVAEVPPGPPVLQTLVAEIYGPDQASRLALATQVKAIFARTPGVVDDDWYVEAPQPKLSLVVDEAKAAAAGVAPATVAQLVRMAGSGESVALLHDATAREDVPIVIRLPRDQRHELASFQAMRLASPHAVSVGELTRVETRTEDVSLYHKNLLPVIYVTGDLAGEDESPVYAIFRMNEAIAQLRLPGGHGVEILNAVQPEQTAVPSMKWDGEWHVTIEVFRDLGIAFGVVLILIYILVVGWFSSFETPLLIMIAIPFSLVGILPAHAAMGAFFTATSMIGFIAGAGIVVRNSIILVDFIELRVREGMPLEQAVVDAGAVRFRPMALTAAAVIVGAGVILFDPIFQGLAVSLMAGEVASLLLSRMAVPVLYYMGAKRRVPVVQTATTAPIEAH